MRVLFTTIPSHGHFHPLVPLAHVLRARGHDVTVATAADFTPVVEATGLPAVAAGLPERELAVRMRERERGLALFAEHAAPAMLGDLLERSEPADVVVHEEGEWGGPVAAAASGVPSVAVGWGAPMWSREELRYIDAAARPLWAAHGLEPRSAAGLFDHLYLDRCPPALQSQVAGVANVRPMRALPPGSTERAAADEPQVYVTLGTVPAFNRDRKLLATIVDALSGEALRVLVTVGPGNDPGWLRQSPGVRVEQYVPQTEALAGSVLAVTHGGAGSTLGALAFGLPVLVLPRGAPSQRRMAAACVRAGVGIALKDDEITERALRAAVRRLLRDAVFRRRAEAVRDQLAQLPPPADVVEALERLPLPARHH